MPAFLHYDKSVDYTNRAHDCKILQNSYYQQNAYLIRIQTEYTI